MRFHLPPLRRRRTAPVQPDGRHLVRGRDPRRQVHHRCRRLVLGRQRRPTAATRPSRRCSATSIRACWHRRWARSPPAPAACVPFNLFGGAGSITQEMMDFVTFVQNDSSEQKMWDLTANLSGNLIELPGGRWAWRYGAEYRDLKGRFDPDPIVAAGLQLRHSGAANKGRLRRQGSLCGAECAAPGGRRFCRPARAERCGSLLRLFDIRARPRPSRPAPTGSRSRTCGLRVSWAEGFRAPSIGELFGTQSRFDQQLSDPCSSHSGNTAPQLPERFDGQGQLYCGWAFPPTAAISRPTRRFRSSSAATRILIPKRQRAGSMARCTARHSCPASRSRSITTTSRSKARSRRSTPISR